MARVTVLIVGGGPVGLSLAIRLAQLGVVGSAAAVGNAIYNATGIRIRNTPSRWTRSSSSSREPSGRDPRSSCRTCPKVTCHVPVLLRLQHR
ncbi:hypothetical protein DMH04_14665 [Kibdelosporangium aridum]|uniref:Uncharacterized protein n=1 Tax=Kibdelosporangium aridum TaxID=2030 RepID=A0A428ZEI4_KIBAR|nr:hypothetical protein DMH04_14665 [Kibdelosporangium aridum]